MHPEIPQADEITGGMADFDSYTGNGKAKGADGANSNYNSNGDLVLPSIHKPKKKKVKRRKSPNKDLSPANLTPSQ